jgi:hypothetical protein
MLAPKVDNKYDIKYDVTKLNTTRKPLKHLYPQTNMKKWNELQTWQDARKQQFVFKVQNNEIPQTKVKSNELIDRNSYREKAIDKTGNEHDQQEEERNKIHSQE